MTTPLKLLAIVAALCGVADGAVSDCVVRVHGGSGVVVSPTGLVLTCKHGLPQSTTLAVDHPTKGRLNGTVVYMPEAIDGVVAIQLPQGDYEFIPVAPAIPQKGEHVTLYAHSNRCRRGKILGSKWAGSDSYLGQKVQVNEISTPIEAGWSGGPAVSAHGVVGVALLSDDRTSFYTGWRETSAVANRFAWQRVNEKPTIDVPATDPRVRIIVYTTPFCEPCERFKRDMYFHPERFQWWTFECVDLSKTPVEGITSAPEFVWPGGSITGYQGMEWLAERLPKPKQPETAQPPVSVIPVEVEKPAPVAPPIEQPKLPEQPPPAPAARVEPSTEVQPTTAGVWGWGLSLAQIGIAVVTGGVGAGAFTAAGKLWGLRSRRKRSQGEPASAGETRAGPYGPAINYHVPALPIFRVPDSKAINAINEAFTRVFRLHATDERTSTALAQAHDIFRQAMSAPDKQGE